MNRSVVNSTPRILIADDHRVVRIGLVQVLSEIIPDAIVEQVGDAESLIIHLRNNLYDLVISDIAMPGASGLEVLRLIKKLYPRLPVLILSMYPEEIFAMRALKAGASGFMNKDFMPQHLHEAIHLLLSGKKYISSSLAENLSENYSSVKEWLPHEQLSDREFEVLRYLSYGQTAAGIAKRLFLSVSTIDSLRVRILTKMKLKTNAQLSFYAIKNKLLDKNSFIQFNQ